MAIFRMEETFNELTILFESKGRELYVIPTLSLQSISEFVGCEEYLFSDLEEAGL